MAAATRLKPLNNRNVSSHSAGGRKSTIKVSAGSAPSGGPGPGLSPGFWWLPATLGVLLACGHITPVSASVSLGGGSPCVSVKKSSSYEDIGVRTHGTPVGPYLDCICNDPITVIFTGTGPLGMNIFWGDTNQSTTGMEQLGAKRPSSSLGKAGNGPQPVPDWECRPLP